VYFNPFDTVEDRVNKLAGRMKKLESTFDEESYQIYFTPTSIKKYIELVIKKQNSRKNGFFPYEKKDFVRYFKEIDPKFDIENLKYDSSDNLEAISKTIANQGKSGYSYLVNIERVINLNKPTLMFYGFEQIAAFYRNSHFNFTDENVKYDSIRNRFQRHGIDPYNFKNFDTNLTLNEIMEMKIKLKIEGFCPIFFLLFESDHWSSLIDLFIDEKEISMIELLKNFFYRNESLPPLILSKFKENFGNELPKQRLNSTVLTIYLISFLFSHISRYKMHTWINLVENDEKNISYYINFILKYGWLIFIKLLFIRLFNNETRLGGTHHESLFGFL